MGVEGGDDEDERAYAKWGESWGTYLQDVYEAQLEASISPAGNGACSSPSHQLGTKIEGVVFALPFGCM